MSDYLQDLRQTRDNIAANLKLLTSDPRPSYSIDGQSFSWNELFTSYTQQLQTLDAQLAASEPFEQHSQGFTP